MSWIMAPEPRGPGGDRSRRPSRVKTRGAATSLGRRCSCLPLAPVVHPPPGRSLVPTLAARHIAKSFGGQVVLDDVSVTVGPSARLAVVGPNGIGKSTLLRLLAGVEEPDRGSVTRTPATLNVGYLPQEPEGSAGESVLGHLWPGGRAWQAPSRRWWRRLQRWRRTGRTSLRRRRARMPRHQLVRFHLVVRASIRHRRLRWWRKEGKFHH